MYYLYIHTYIIKPISVTIQDYIYIAPNKNTLSHSITARLNIGTYMIQFLN